MNVLYEISGCTSRAPAIGCCHSQLIATTISWSYLPPRSSISRKDSAMDPHAPVTLVTSQCLSLNHKEKFVYADIP